MEGCWGAFECRMLYLDERIQSFKHPKWPHGSHYGLALADAGFYYLGETDKCQCCKCGLMEHRWDPKVDIPVCEHDRDSPACEERFQQKVKDEFNIIKPVNGQEEFEREQSQNMKELGDLDAEVFRLEQMGDEEKRIAEVKERIQQINDRQNEMVCDHLKERNKASDGLWWDHIDLLMKDCKGYVNLGDNVPRCALIVSSISMEQLHPWADKMIQSKILCGLTGERIFLSSNTKADCMRIIMDTLSRKLLSDWVQAMRLKTEIMGRMNQACIKTMVDYWARVGAQEGLGRTVVQEVTSDVFACLSEKQMKLWFAEIYSSEVISGHLYYVLQHSEKPKTTMAEVMNGLDAIKYIQYVQLLQKIGQPQTDHLVRQLGQENYLTEKKPDVIPTPPPTPTLTPEASWAAVKPLSPVKLLDRGFKLGKPSNPPSIYTGFGSKQESSSFERFVPYTPKKTPVLEFSSKKEEKEPVGTHFGGPGWGPVQKKEQKHITMLEKAADLMRDLAGLIEEAKREVKEKEAGLF